MTHLDDIERRHGLDLWRDLLFVGAAVLLTALAIGATTSKGIGKPTEHTWSVTVVDPETQIEMR